MTGFMLYAELNSTKLASPPEQLLRRKAQMLGLGGGTEDTAQAAEPGELCRYNDFPHPSIDGPPYFTEGHWTICPRGHKRPLSKAFIMYYQGRKKNSSVNLISID
jgi:hypothetical protein